jgi:ABC-type antimicrobial peptide transport system permease subunit
MIFDHLRALWTRVRNVGSRERHDRDFDEEIAAHLQMATEDNVRRGMSADEARRVSRSSVSAASNRHARPIAMPAACQSLTARSRIINSRLAHAFWPRGDALDREVTINNLQARVVGVVADVRHGSLESVSGFEIYLPMSQQGASTVDLVVRVRTAAVAVIPDLRATLSAFDPTMPLNDIRPVRYLVDRAVSPRRFVALLLVGFAAMALLLASLGIYGVVSGSVTRQNREIGLRLALGAMPRQVQLRLIGQTVGLATIGVAIGTAAAFAGSRAMNALVFGVSAVDPLTFVAVPLILAGVAVLAGAIPACRAGRIDPVSALRET